MRKLQYAAFAVVTAGVLAALAAMAFATGPAKGDQHGSVPKETREIVKAISADNIQSSIHTLVGFGTRHTLSSQTDPNRGIGAATQWVFDQFQQIAATSGGRMTVEKQSFVQPPGPRIPMPTVITNVIATLRGSQPESVGLDLPRQRPPRLPLHRRARLHVRRAGSGRRRLGCRGGARDGPRDGYARVRRDDQVRGVLRRGAGHLRLGVLRGPGEGGRGEHRRDVLERHHRLDARPERRARPTRRAGVRGRTVAERDAAEATIRRTMGGENDTPPRELARFIRDVAEPAVPTMNVWIIYRRDRFLRGSDDGPFLDQRLPGLRMTEPNEDLPARAPERARGERCPVRRPRAVRRLRLHRERRADERRGARGARERAGGAAEREGRGLDAVV